MKKAAIALVLLATAGMAFLAVAPGISRIRRYEKAFSRPGALAVLSMAPVRVDLPRNAAEPNISLGYAQLWLDPKSVRSIERRGDHKTIVQIEVEGASLIFMSPGSTLELDDTARTLPNGPVSHHDLMLEVAAAAPKTWLELFFMPEERFQAYLVEATLKTAMRLNELGIGLFEADEITGIIHFGEASNPGGLLAEVFSRKSDIAQGIHMKAATTEEGLKTFQEILGSFGFAIDRAPERRAEIASLILDALRSHPKFRE